MSGSATPAVHTPTDLVNLALVECGNRQPIRNLATDQSAQAVTSRQLYTPKVTMLMRAANWSFLRADAALTLWKAAVINGTASTNPPPAPFLYSYLYPSDCLRVRFLLPTIPVAAPSNPPLTTNMTPQAFMGPIPVGIPFVPGTDFDAQGNPIRVILTNLQNAKAVYTRDLSQSPMLWDPLFLNAASAFLACFLIQANMRNGAQYQQQVAAVTGVLDQARSIDGSEAIPSVDHVPDWMAARMTVGSFNGWNQAGAPMGYGGLGGYDACVFPDGLRW